MEVYAQLIGSLGFPIIACIALALYVKDENTKNRQETKDLNEQHTAEMSAFKDEIKEALNNNTLALTKLCDKLDGKEVKSDEIK